MPVDRKFITQRLWPSFVPAGPVPRLAREGQPRLGRRAQPRVRVPRLGQEERHRARGRQMQLRLPFQQRVQQALVRRAAGKP